MVGGQLGFVRSFLIKLDNSQPLSFTNITLDWFREKNNRDLFSHNFNVDALYVCHFIKKNLQIDT